MDRESNANLILWMLAGVTLGGIGALLIAPEAGASTRKKLAAGAQEGRKSLMESGQELFTKGRDLFEQGREIAEDMAVLLEKSRAIAEKKVEDRF